MDKQERMQRVRVGLTGLAAVLVVVAAAAAVFESASDEPVTASAPNAIDSATVVENMLPPEEETPNEPLAEIGAAPASGKTESEKQAEAEAAAEKAVQGANGS